MDPIEEASVNDTMKAEDRPPSPRSVHKDRILNRVASHVKAIHNLKCNSLNQEEFLLTNADSHSHQLVESLDHALFHGLKSSTDGYWPLSKSLSHSSVIKDIENFAKIKTNIERGRAWLYESLNEHLLECYLRHLTENANIVKKLYSKGALLCDQPRLHSLLSLTEGLENVRFDLDGNIPHLDIAFPKFEKKRSVDVDMVQTEDAKYSCDSSQRFQKIKSILKAPSSHSIVIGQTESETEPSDVIVARGNSVDLLRKPGRVFDCDVPLVDEPIEWTAVRPKRATKKKKKRSDLSSLASTPSSASLSGRSTPESGYKSSYVDSDLTRSLLKRQCSTSDHLSLYSAQDRESIVFDEDLILQQILSQELDGKKTSQPKTSASTTYDDPISSTPAKCTEESIYDVKTENLSTAMNTPDDSSTTVEDSENHAQNSSTTVADSENHTQESVNVGDDLNSPSHPSSPKLSSFSSIEQIQMQLHGCNQLDIDRAQQFSAMCDYDNFSHPCIKTDNNLKLMLTLELFNNPDEQLINVFEVGVGITEGLLQPLHLIVSTYNLYLVHVKCITDYKFTIDSVLPLNNIDYLSMSINYQIVSIVCHKRDDCRCLSTGDHGLSWYIAQNLQNAYSNEDLGLGPLTILIDATVQKIGLRKWVMQETKQESEPPYVISYTLVHWEEVSARKLNAPSSSIGGHLKVHSGGNWVDSYFSLKDNVLSEYSEADMNDPPLKTIPINSSTVLSCTELRLFSLRDYSFGIEMVNNALCEFIAPTYELMTKWIAAIRAAMKRPPHPESLPCCSVVTPEYVMLCHEDLQTNFFRTLCVVPLHEVACILVDNHFPVCVLMIEMKEDVNYWIFHLTSIAERDRYAASLAVAWMEQFKVPIDVKPIDDNVLKTWCTFSSKAIQSKWNPRILQP